MPIIEKRIGSTVRPIATSGSSSGMTLRSRPCFIFSKPQTITTSKAPEPTASAASRSAVEEAAEQFSTFTTGSPVGPTSLTTRWPAATPWLTWAAYNCWISRHCTSASCSAAKMASAARDSTLVSGWRPKWVVAMPTM